MDKEEIISYAVLAYRRMQNMEYDEKLFESVLLGVMDGYSVEELNKEINKRETR